MKLITGNTAGKISVSWHRLKSRLKVVLVIWTILALANPAFGFGTLRTITGITKSYMTHCRYQYIGATRGRTARTIAEAKDTWGGFFSDLRQGRWYK